jgi:RecA/RadA recombinase
VVWLDAEGMFDKDWAEKLGCDLDRLHVARPATGNEGVDMIEALMEPKEVGMIVLDSVPGFVPQRIADKSAEDSTMGELARLMGIMCSKIYCSWAKERRRNHYVTIVLINQFRMKIGQMFGDPRTLPGGRQINHLPTTKVELKNNEVGGKDSFDSHMMIRNEHSFKITKAKHGRSIREGEFHISLSPEANDGVGEFEFINHKAVITHAKKFGLLTGGAGKYRLDTIEDQTFRTYDDIGAYLLESPRVMAATQRLLIGMQREDKGLSAIPEDGYLVGPAETARKIRRK